MVERGEGGVRSDEGGSDGGERGWSGVMEGGGVREGGGSEGGGGMVV